MSAAKWHKCSPPRAAAFLSVLSARNGKRKRVFTRMWVCLRTNEIMRFSFVTRKECRGVVLMYTTTGVWFYSGRSKSFRNRLRRLYGCYTRGSVFSKTRAIAACGPCLLRNPRRRARPRNSIRIRLHSGRAPHFIIRRQNLKQRGAILSIDTGSVPRAASIHLLSIRALRGAPFFSVYLYICEVPLLSGVAILESSGAIARQRWERVDIFPFVCLLVAGRYVGDAAATLMFVSCLFPEG